MKKTARFIVLRRHWILGLTVCLAVVCAYFATQVGVNSDMSKYLSDDSSMKIGVDIMAEEFPEMDTPKTIRVMAEGLTDEQKDELAERLGAIEYVDGVDYDDSAEHNRDGCSLFVVSTSYDYESEEELAIEKALANDFSEYGIVYHNDNTAEDPLPLMFTVAAVVIAMLILFAMSQSWFEPVIMLIGIIFAVIINMGTNIFLGEISNITASISAILQMVLSMDYSIILMNRYRQEKELGLGKIDAMITAVRNSFNSIASSSLTTVAGLIALVFMDFKIGFDIGIVLAKGVFISMICVLTILPCLILWCDRVIERTAKKSLHIPMGGMARISHRFRYLFVIIFIVAFGAFYTLQQNTGISFSAQLLDPIADVFPKENTLVMVYENEDEDRVLELADTIGEHPDVKQVMSYPSLLGKPYTAQELDDSISRLESDLGADLGDDIELDPTLLEIIYYHYYDGSSHPIAMGDFLSFLADDVLGADAFADMIDDVLRSQADSLNKFADSAELTADKSVRELAGFLDMDEGTVKSLLLYYYMQNGGADFGKLTLAEFVDFVSNDIANDPDYGGMIDSSVLAQMSRLEKLAHGPTVVSRYRYAEVADMIGIDDETALLLFVYYYALTGNHVPEGMTLPEFVSFLQTDVSQSPLFSSYIDPAAMAQLSSLAPFTDPAALQTPRTSGELAAALGLDEGLVRVIFSLYSVRDAGGRTMTLPQFTGFLCGSVLTDPLFACFFDDSAAQRLRSVDSLAQLAASGQALPAAQLAAILGLPEEDVQGIFMYQSAVTQTEVTAMTLPDFLAAASAAAPENAQLQQLGAIVQLAASRAPLDTAALAGMFGLDESMVTLLFRLYFAGDVSGMTVTTADFIDFVLSDAAADPVIGAYIGAESAAQLQQAQQLIGVTLSGAVLSTAELSALFGIDETMLKVLLTYRDAAGGLAYNWFLSPYTLVNFIMDNSSAFSPMMDENALAQFGVLHAFINSAANVTEYNPRDMGRFLGMDEKQLESLYLLYISRRGDTSAWRMSVQDMVDFIAGDVLTNDEFSGLLDSGAADSITGAKKVIDAVVSGSALTPDETHGLLGGLTDGLDADTVELLYLYYASQNGYDPGWTLTIDEMFTHLHDNMLDDPRLSAFIDEDMESQVTDLRGSLQEGVDMLKTGEHSRMIIYTTLPEESEETTAFITGIIDECSDFSGGYHLIGNSAMYHELSLSFDDELMLITLLSSIAIFIIVMLSFRSLIIPLMLVLLVQCGVYITVTIVGIQGYAIHYMALLMVECILMGASIDYAILFTNYYRENRKDMLILDALKAAYKGAIHTITTSGMIIVLVTAIIGYTYSDPMISQICRTISIGMFSVIMLILFVLPGMISAFDALVAKKRYKEVKESSLPGAAALAEAVAALDAAQNEVKPMIRIITDSSADFEPGEYDKLGVGCIPLCVSFGDREYQENVDLTKEQFYELLARSEAFPHTSQPAPYTIEAMLREAMDAGDETIIICLSSRISGFYQNLLMIKDRLGYKKCRVIDSKSGTGGHRLLVEHAVKLRGEGRSADEIAAEVEELRGRIVLYACMDTLEYLHRGGRISHTAYTIGSMAHIKPILHIAPDGSLEVPAKTLGMNKGMDFLCRQLKRQEPDPDFPLYVMFTGERSNGEALAGRFRELGRDIPEGRIIPVGSAIGAHVGPGACGMCYIGKK